MSEGTIRRFPVLSCGTLLSVTWARKSVYVQGLYSTETPSSRAVMSSAAEGVSGRSRPFDILQMSGSRTAKYGADGTRRTVLLRRVQLHDEYTQWVYVWLPGPRMILPIVVSGTRDNTVQYKFLQLWNRTQTMHQISRSSQAHVSEQQRL